MDAWSTLSPVDVNEHTDQKGKFTYLSWTYAWKYVKDRYPDANYELLPNQTYADGSVEVHCAVTIDGLRHVMWLAVTDFNNKAVQNPSCDLVANARMRCLVKAIGMHGLGFYIYAGESLPQEPTVHVSRDMIEEFNRVVAASDPVAFMTFWREMSDDVKIELYNTAPKGHKTKMKQRVSDLERQFHTMAEEYEHAISAALANDDQVSLMQNLEEIGTDKVLKSAVWQRIDPPSQQAIKDILKAQGGNE